MGDAFLSVHFLTPFYAMGLAFFDNQKTDYIGDLSVRLQYFLIAIFFFLTIDLIILIILAATAVGFVIPLPFTLVPWLVTPIGFGMLEKKPHSGAYLRYGWCRLLLPLDVGNGHHRHYHCRYRYCLWLLW